ncbi:MAG: DNA methylase [Chloroflexi bacterium]|nr:DNA methylase [Chloroflexota bacterium]
MRHRFHALCPYFSMFPESFAEKWIETLTEPGDLVLDPFCGRGTAPFQALLMRRQAIGSDVNPVAYCVSRAKTNAPAASQLRRRLTLLEKHFEPAEWEKQRKALPSFFRLAFAPRTLRQLLFLRAELRWSSSNVDAMIAALTLGSLHGEMSSPSYLSNQMPRTISTKPGYSVKYWKAHELMPPTRDTFGLLRTQLAYRYASDPPEDSATIFHRDFRMLPTIVGSLPKPPRLAITSPPYLDVTSAEEDQWLRLWFLGGAPEPTYGVVSRDDRISDRNQYWALIADMWRVLGSVLDENADVVIRIGIKSMKPGELVDAVEASSAFSGRPTTLVHHESSAIARRQTNAFHPGTKGVMVEVDCHIHMA